MAIKTATPYFILNGKAKQAVQLYERALGARVETLQHFGDVDQSCPEELKDLVMHAELRAGDAVLLLSDGSGVASLPGGGNVNVALGCDDPAEAQQNFDALAATGTVVQPLIDAPWGALFGIVQDEYGISWMFNCSKP